jgi:ferredoxin-NADP reductase
VTPPDVPGDALGARPRGAVPPVGGWQQATVVAVRPETPTAKTFRLALSRPMPYLPGQHLVVRLTAPDGYRAQRSYSIATAPTAPTVPPVAGDGDREVELTVELLPGGEVSSFLHEVVAPGDELEVRGPIGGHFVWAGDGPVVLVGGGSGVVPLASMLRSARRQGIEHLVRMVVSTRRPADLYYAGELTGPGVRVVYTREAPAGDPRVVGRITADDLAPALLPGATGYVCGTSGFADAVSDLLVGLGLPPERIRVERFGPTG